MSTPQTSIKIPQVSISQSGPIIQTTVQMPAGKTGTSKIITSQPQFTYQPYQGPYKYGHVPQTPVYPQKLYPGYTYQIHVQPKYVPVILGYPGGNMIPNAQPIPGYPRYPPPGTGLVSQGYPQDPTR